MKESSVHNPGASRRFLPLILPVIFTMFIVMTVIMLSLSTTELRSAFTLPDEWQIITVSNLAPTTASPSTAPPAPPSPGTQMSEPPKEKQLTALPPLLDSTLTRRGEKYLSTEDFLACLAKRLNVDHRTKAEHPFANVNETIPYLVMPVTVEQGDMKALMCNIDVPIRHLMYVQNGGVGSMTRFLDRVQEAFAFTPRLKIVRMPRNYGYSVALNVAMRDALSLPFDDVPFFLMGNNDVRFPAGLLTKGLPLMYERSLPGRAKIAELEAEVATEPNAHTPAQFREVPLRSTDGRHVLVTSRLLPDRIRYQPKAERRKAFADYYGAVFPDAGEPSAFWGLTRLAMEVTGFFDENCYPAYYEDTDYLRRMWLLGLKPSSVPGVESTPVSHIGGGAILSVKGFQPAPELADVLPFIGGATYVIHRGYSGAYIASKYHIKDAIWPDSGGKEPYEGEGFPLDILVVDEPRQQAISELQRLAVEFSSSPDLGASTPMELMVQRGSPLVPELFKILKLRFMDYRDGNALRLLPSSAQQA